MAHLLHDSLFNNTWQHELDHEHQLIELRLQVTKACELRHESAHDHGALLPGQQCRHDYSMVACS